MIIFNGETVLRLLKLYNYVCNYIMFAIIFYDNARCNEQLKRLFHMAFVENDCIFICSRILSYKFYLYMIFFFYFYLASIPLRYFGSFLLTINLFFSNILSSLQQHFMLAMFYDPPHRFFGRNSCHFNHLNCLRELI